MSAEQFKGTCSEIVRLPHTVFICEMWDVITNASEKLYNERKLRKAEEAARCEESNRAVAELGALQRATRTPPVVPMKAEAIMQGGGAIGVVIPSIIPPPSTVSPRTKGIVEVNGQEPPLLPKETPT